MSIKKGSEELTNILNKIYPENKLKITEWNGFTKPIRYLCDICGKEHSYTDARILIGTQTYCQKCSQTNKRWDKEAYQKRLNTIFEEEIEIIEYSGLSAKITYNCPICGKIKSAAAARVLLSRMSLCDECYGTEKNITKRKLDTLLKENENKYQLIAWRGVTKKLTIKCLSCGAVYDRWPKSTIECFDNCPNCNSNHMKQMISLEDYQKRINEEFGENQYELIAYTGQLKKDNKVKCLNCGLIFNFQASTFIKDTRGCPKCKRYHSKGEQAVQRYLEENGIRFETQKRFSDCNNNLSSFDFCCYDSDEKMYLIEINGRQHYEQTNKFGDLKIIQERDKKKYDYCKEHSIPLIIIPYNKTLPKEEIDKHLSFLKGSTTIPTGSKGEASLK